MKVTKEAPFALSTKESIEMPWLKQYVIIFVKLRNLIARVEALSDVNKVDPT